MHCPWRTAPTFVVALVFLMMSLPGSASAQQADPDTIADEVLAERPVDEATSEGPLEEPGDATINLLQLVFLGGWLMIPITFMSVVVVAVGIERSLALRRSRVIPRDLVESLDELCVAPGGLDLRRAARVCADFPSAAATVVKSVLLKLGRPAAEVERAVADSMQREAERLYRHVRTLNLAATVTPLIGLLGTVWGMIQAFFVTANLPVGANKAQSLAEGIYIALVTTAGGLVVAIPAAMLAHVLEGRIQKLFVEIGEFIAQRLMPQVERLEGRVRIQRSPPPQAPPPPPVVESAGAK